MNTVKLGEIASFSQGLQVPISEQEPIRLSDDYVRFIRIVDYTDETTDIRFIKRPASKFFVNEDDLVMVRYGSSSMGMIGRGKRGVIANNMFKISPNEKYTHKPYLFYCLKSDAVQRSIWLANASSTMPALTFTIAGNLEIPLPPLIVQQRIASILSAYDELIENNQRRIKILETMARNLYREWFVHFRFPGHENHPRVDSPLGEIPQGWEVKTVAESFEIYGGGTPSRKEDRYWENGTIQWFSPSDLTGAGTMFMDDSGDHITALGLAKSSARLFPAHSVMLTSRATIGAIAINTQEACTNQGFIVCLPSEHAPLYFLFNWLKENVPTFERMASGATFKEISRGVFKTIEFLQPPAILVSRFEEAASPMAEQAHALQRQVENLRQTRDLLLPRLLSGQITLPEAADDLTQVTSYA